MQPGGDLFCYANTKTVGMEPWLRMMAVHMGDIVTSLRQQYDRAMREEYEAR